MDHDDRFCPQVSCWSPNERPVKTFHTSCCSSNERAKEVFHNRLAKAGFTKHINPTWGLSKGRRIVHLNPVWFIWRLVIHSPSSSISLNLLRHDFELCIFSYVTKRLWLPFSSLAAAHPLPLTNILTVGFLFFKRYHCRWSSSRLPSWNGLASWLDIENST